jgi:Tfp pilus assembly protein PilF
MIFRILAGVQEARREIVLLGLLAAIALVAFAGTHALARHERDVRLRDAAAWHERGRRDLAAGARDDAIRALRRAVLLDRGRREYATALGRALAEAGRADEAGRVLVRLRAASPDDPAINLELARLAATRAEVDRAVHYYHSALYGLWPGERAADRNAVRAELARFLLLQDRRPAALAELVALGTTTPETAAARVELGGMFLGAGDPARALDEFRRALRIDPRAAGALAGAGEAAFALDRFADARGYFRQARSLPPRLEELRDLADAVLTSDPLAPRIAPAERRRRLLAALARAQARAAECLARLDAGDPARPALEAAQAEARAAAAAAGGPGVIERAEAGVDLTYRIEQRAEQACPGGTRLDAALLIIGRRHAETADE